MEPFVLGRPGGSAQLGSHPSAPDELIRAALLMCGDCDMTSQFHIGVDLMIRGLDAYLGTRPAEATASD